jgi:hypothetical protein
MARIQLRARDRNLHPETAGLPRQLLPDCADLLCQLLADKTNLFPTIPRGDLVDHLAWITSTTPAAC